MVDDTEANKKKHLPYLNEKKQDSSISQTVALININIEIILTIKFVKHVLCFELWHCSNFPAALLEGVCLQGHFGVGTKKNLC